MEKQEPTFSIPNGFHKKPLGMFKPPAITIPKNTKPQVSQDIVSPYEETSPISTRYTRFHKKPFNRGRGANTSHGFSPRGRGGFTPRERGTPREHRQDFNHRELILDLHENNAMLNTRMDDINNQFIALTEAMQRLESRISILEDSSTSKIGIAVQRTLDSMKNNISKLDKEVKNNKGEADDAVMNLWSALASQSAEE